MDEERIARDAAQGMAEDLAAMVATNARLLHDVPQVCPDCNGQGLMSPQAGCRSCLGHGMAVGCPSCNATDTVALVDGRWFCIACKWRQRPKTGVDHVF